MDTKKDIQVGKEILNEVMGGNPFKQLSQLRKAILILKSNQDVIINELQIGNNEIIVSNNEIYDELLEYNNKIENILIRHYPNEYSEIKLNKNNEKVILSDKETADKLDNL